MKKHIDIKSRAAYAQLYHINKFRKYLDQKNAEKLIHALVHSHTDHCNVLLTGLHEGPHRKLQMVQNTTARVLYKVVKWTKNILNIWNGDYGLRSRGAFILDVPRTKHKILHGRAFRAAAPKEWNDCQAVYAALKILIFPERILRLISFKQHIANDCLKKSV